MDNRFKNLSIFFGVSVLYLFLSVEFALLVTNLNLRSNILSNIVLLCGELFTCFVCVLIFHKEFKKDKDSFNKHGKVILKMTLKYWGIGLLLMLFSNIILNNVVGSIAQNESINRSVLLNNYIYAIPTMIIVAPICEEIIFRLSLGKLVKNKLLFSTLSGLLFGYLHVMGETGLASLYIIPYAILGFCFAYLYKSTNNIFSSISAHIIHNLLCIIILTI